MFRISRSLWNYGWLTRYIYQFYQLSLHKQIQENDINQFVHKIIPYIEKCGCVCTKFAQWLTPILDNLYNEIDKEPYWLKQLEKFYEQCQDHSLEYTLERYRLDFFENILNTYTIEDVIGSGSVGQVYKIKDKNTKIDYAMKVLHPNVYHDMWFMKQVIHFLLWIPYTRKIIHDILPLDLCKFIELFETQIDMIHEANNLLIMDSYYKDNNYIHIPYPVRISKNIFIMSYEEGETFDSINISEYEKMKLINIFSLFVKNNHEILNFNHGDIHKSNWKIQQYNNTYRLIIYDFGYCWRHYNPKLANITTKTFANTTNDDYIMLIDYSCMLLKDQSESTKQLFMEYINSNNNKGNLIVDPGFTFKGICYSARQLDILIDPIGIQSIIMYIQTNKYWTKYGLNNKLLNYKGNYYIYRSNFIDSINFCNTYDIFPQLMEQFKEELNEMNVDINELFDTLDQSNTINDEIKGLLKFD